MTWRLEPSIGKRSLRTFRMLFEGLHMKNPFRRYEIDLHHAMGIYMDLSSSKVWMKTKILQHPVMLSVLTRMINNNSCALCHSHRHDITWIELAKIIPRAAVIGICPCHSTRRSHPFFNFLPLSADIFPPISG